MYTNRFNITKSRNISILPMAFLTFAEAKVVAPPIVLQNKLVIFTYHKHDKGGLSFGVVN